MIQSINPEDHLKPYEDHPEFSLFVHQDESKFCTVFRLRTKGTQRAYGCEVHKIYSDPKGNSREYSAAVQRLIGSYYHSDNWGDQIENLMITRGNMRLETLEVPLRISTPRGTASLADDYGLYLNPGMILWFSPESLVSDVVKEVLKKLEESNV